LPTKGDARGEKKRGVAAPDQRHVAAIYDAPEENNALKTPGLGQRFSDLLESVVLQGYQ